MSSLVDKYYIYEFLYVSPILQIYIFKNGSIK